LPKLLDVEVVREGKRYRFLEGERSNFSRSDTDSCVGHVGR
jgi:hypothetical protein